MILDPLSTKASATLGFRLRVKSLEAESGRVEGEGGEVGGEGEGH